MTKGSWLFNKRSPLAGECRHHHNSCICRSPFFLSLLELCICCRKTVAFVCFECRLHSSDRNISILVFNVKYHCACGRTINGAHVASDVNGYEFEPKSLDWHSKYCIIRICIKLCKPFFFHYCYAQEIYNYFESLFLSALFILIDDGSYCVFFIHLLFTLNISFHRIINWLSEFGSVIALLFDAYAGCISHRKSRAIQQYIATYTGI